MRLAQHAHRRWADTTQLIVQVTYLALTPLFHYILTSPKHGHQMRILQQQLSDQGVRGLLKYTCTKHNHICKRKGKGTAFQI